MDGLKHENMKAEVGIEYKIYLHKTGGVMLVKDTVGPRVGVSCEERRP